MCEQKERAENRESNQSNKGSQRSKVVGLGLGCFPEMRFCGVRCLLLPEKFHNKLSFCHADVYRGVFFLDVVGQNPCQLCRREMWDELELIRAIAVNALMLSVEVT